MPALPRPDRERVRSWGRRVRHPLWWLPDSVDEQEEGYRRIWQQLRQMSTVEDGRHDTEQWRNRSGRFALCCVRVPASALGPELAEVRRALQALPFVRLHPDHFLHITIQELGFVTEEPIQRDEFGVERLDEFIEMAERPIAGFAAFDLTLGGVNSFADAAFLDVRDDGWLARIHRRLRDFLILPVDARYPYLPVLTIAHYVADAPISRLPAILAPWRDTRFGSFTVDAVEIVLLQPDEAYPHLEVVHTFPLGTVRAAADVVLRPR
jgi:2'-5' RNA ligase